MRESSPSPVVTVLTSALTLSQIEASSLMNETRVARKTLEAYLIIWAVVASVSMYGIVCFGVMFSSSGSL